MLTEDDILQRLRVDADTVSILCADEASEIAGTIDELRNQCGARGEEIARMKDAVEKLREALKGVIDACQTTKMVPACGGAIGQTIEAGIKASVYLRVPAWPIEEAISAYYETDARAVLDETEKK